MKTCFVCKEEKEDIQFYKSSKSTDGLHHYCKSCCKSHKLNKKRTSLGLLKVIYSHQKKSNRIRGHGLISYSLKEFIDRFLFDKDYNDLFDKWKKSNYEKLKTPSFDRKDDFKGYSFDNIQIMTWEENTNKGHLDRLLGLGTQGEANCKAVLQFSQDGTFIAEYYSIMEAERQTGVSGKHIPSVCNGKRKKAGGFIWKHKYIKEEQTR